MAEVFLAIVGFMLAIIVIYFIISFQMAREQKFKAAAIRVDARILEMRYSSSSDSGSVTYKMKVTFTTDRGPETAVGSATLSPPGMIYVKDHKTIPTYYLKDNPQKILIATDEIPDLLSQ
ncbi:DUF3592 domain-containing protein [Cronobacter dublinensis]|uniref:DUF3592 domain-containing protein n=1 Tax=Cronobacter dublinensis TaxID=413497 RepID=UPI00029C1592|nr:DUF3592 domain-containing protein [Cronobacter dublinensis]CCJ85384.1 hypothetical protein BN133_1761 [Cronobacter dublinensis 582]EKY3088793.1 DUF3592 domain-containing protein [Cronobacter dublinensis]ELQ6228701.1 DUF3592 domain-containing protein [Cronobacter dublinensis]ELY4004544.1 DUF3592 domain-containing protein [Cronobacter dublinensis]ELY4406752.1 DUF3592 domain-containing protein [Cronobacter dublinensis]